MTRTPAVLVAAALAGFVLSGAARGAYAPSLLVSSQPTGAAQTGTVRLTFAQPAADDATAKLLVVVPREYRVIVDRAPGGVLGTATAQIASASVGGPPIAVSGTIVVGSGSESQEAAARACDASGFHAVWLVTFSTPIGRDVVVSIFVEPTTAGVRLHVCLPSPYVPEALGGAPFGVKLVFADLEIGGTFTSPGTPGRYVWSGLFTSFQVGTAIRGTTVEARAIVPVPARMTLRRKLVGSGRSRQVVLSGRLTEAGTGVRGVRVELYSVVNPRGRDNRLRRVAVGRTRAGGRFSFRRRVARTLWYVALVPARDVTSTACADPVAPGGCVRALLAPRHSALVRVRRPTG